MDNNTVELEIESLSVKGEGFANYLDKTIYVHGALPGEKVIVTLSEIHSSYAIGLLKKILRPSPKRKEPICPLFTQCGGCQLMHLEESEQLSFKRDKVIEALKDEKLNIEVLPCSASPQQLGYRNKVQLPILFSAHGTQIGLYHPHSHEIIPMERCYIQHPLAEKIWAFLKPFIPQSALRYILIKVAPEKEEALVVFVSKTSLKSQLIPISHELIKTIPQVKGVVENINSAEGNAVLGKTFLTVCGQNFIHEQLGNFLFKITASSFFQINPPQALRLYQKAIELAGIKKDDVVLDAFCGIGTLSLFAAQQAKQVYGIEFNEEAIENAKQNAQLNHIYNCDFYGGKAEHLIEKLEAIDVAFINPPRKGCEPSFLNQLMSRAPRTIIYISCNPQSLAKDLSRLSKNYTITPIQPFDMFPQTHHVESIACCLQNQ